MYFSQFLRANESPEYQDTRERHVDRKGSKGSFLSRLLTIYPLWLVLCSWWKESGQISRSMSGTQGLRAWRLQMEKAAQTNGFKVGEPLITVAANSKDSQVIKLKWDNLTVTEFNMAFIQFSSCSVQHIYWSYKSANKHFLFCHYWRRQQDFLHLSLIIRY